MGANTHISWTGSTWNPIRGCSRVSSGCMNCYAESVAYRFSGQGQPYEGLVTIGPDGKHKKQWNGTVRVVNEHMLDPLRWKKPRRIFVNSMSDLFHENLPDEEIDKVFAVMALSARHDFQILTKRAERMRAYMMAFEKCDIADRLESAAAKLGCSDDGTVIYRTVRCWPLPNVWLGVSVEDQKTADERIPLLLETPAATRFISAEPLLGEIDLNKNIGGTQWIGGQRGCEGSHYGNGSYECPKTLHHHHDDRCKPELNWVICGGESGRGARPMNPDWARKLRDQCLQANVPFFFKQWGEWGPCENGEMTPDPEDAGCASHIFPDPSKPRCLREMVWLVGKKIAGDLLDGKRWHQFPEDVCTPSPQ